MMFLDDMERAKQIRKLAARLPDGSTAKAAAERDADALERRAQFDQDLLELSASVEVWHSKGEWPPQTTPDHRGACEECTKPGMAARDIANNALVKLGRTRHMPRPTGPPEEVVPPKPAKKAKPKRSKPKPKKAARSLPATTPVDTDV
jgi:hypothetical protein